MFDTALKGLESKTVVNYIHEMPTLHAKIKSIDETLNGIEQKILVSRQAESAARDAKSQQDQEAAMQELRAQLEVMEEDGPSKCPSVNDFLVALKGNYDDSLDRKRQELGSVKGELLRVQHEIQAGLQELERFRAGTAQLVAANQELTSTNQQLMGSLAQLQVELQRVNRETAQTHAAQAQELVLANQRSAGYRTEWDRINGLNVEQIRALTEHAAANKSLVKSNQELTGQITTQAAELQRISEELAQQRTALSEREAENQRLQGVIDLTKHDEKRQQLRDVISAQAAELIKHKEMIAAGAEGDARGIQQLNECKATLASAKEELKESQQTLDAKERELAVQSAKVQELESQLQDSAQANQAARLALEEKDQQLAQQKPALPQFGAKMEDDCKSQLFMLTQELQSANEELEKLKGYGNTSRNIQRELLRLKKLKTSEANDPRP